MAVSETVLDPNVLTLGFARRFTDYKRPDLLLSDPARLAHLLCDEARPAQLVLAGKAHPDDEAGKRMIQEWIGFAQDPRYRRRVVFLEDYDISLAQELVQGVDVWINTPRRPWEACGTSGMKVLVNGGLNLSTLDGWWEEAYSPGSVGRSATDQSPNQPTRIATTRANSMRLLEREVVPAFYDRDADGVPRAWVARMRRSMTDLTMRYSASRMVREYLDKAYLPAAKALRERVADGAAVAKAMAEWDQHLHRAWPGVHIGEPDFVKRMTAGRSRCRFIWRYRPRGCPGGDSMPIRSMAGRRGDRPVARRTDHRSDWRLFLPRLGPRRAAAGRVYGARRAIAPGRADSSRNLPDTLAEMTGPRNGRCAPTGSMFGAASPGAGRRSDFD